MVIKLGSFLICLMLMFALPVLPRIELSSLQGFYSTAWTFLGCIVAVAFLKDFFRQR